jgi:RHS repeat-associated protein
VRRYVGNVLVVQTGSGASYRLKRQILLTDAQGSTQQVVSAVTLLPTNAATPASFDAWGLRRTGDTWSNPAPWTGTLEPLLRATTTHGYTGHEMAESVGVIHMNGRIYDPHFARFLQADPFVQSPGNGQSWNRYAYGFNNPMGFTDPTGYTSTGDYLRIAAAIVITVYSGGTAAGATWGLFGGAALTTGQAVAVVAVGGFAAGAVQTGTLRGALTGAVSAAVFYGVGSAFSQANSSWAYNSDNSLNFSGYAAKTLAHGVAGGVMSSLQGGNFGHGFASAGVGEALSPAIGSIKSTPVQAVAAAVVGGTTSVVAGGKFGNGAVTAAFGYAFNSLNHPTAENKNVEVTNFNDDLDPFVGPLSDDQQADVAAANQSISMLRDTLNAAGDAAQIEKFNKTSFNYVPGYTDPDNPQTAGSAGIDKRNGDYIIRLNKGFARYVSEGSYIAKSYNFQFLKGGPTLGFFLVAHEFGHVNGSWNNEAGASNFAAKFIQGYPGGIDNGALYCRENCK